MSARVGIIHVALSLTVQLFQGELLGLSDEAEDHEPSDKVKTSVETDYSWGQCSITRQDSAACTYKLQWGS